MILLSKSLKNVSSSVIIKSIFYNLINNTLKKKNQQKLISNGHFMFFLTVMEWRVRRVRRKVACSGRAREGAAEAAGAKA